MHRTELIRIATSGRSSTPGACARRSSTRRNTHDATRDEQPQRSAPGRQRTGHRRARRHRTGRGTASAHSTHRSHHSASLGTTTVTTAKGIAATLVKAGILPLPVLPKTGFGLSFRGGLTASYGFPITSSTADLASRTGDILHSGGIRFVSRKASLEIGTFDIDLAAGKVFATEVNYAPAKIAVLDLDLTGLKVGTGRCGSTVLSGITATLDGAAAGALNATFKLALPTDGSRQFGISKVVLKGGDRSSRSRYEDSRSPQGSAREVVPCVVEVEVAVPGSMPAAW
jgi:hypothetical protein